MTPEQVMLVCLLAVPPVTLPIPEKQSFAHLKHNLGALGLALWDAAFTALS